MSYSWWEARGARRALLTALLYTAVIQHGPFRGAVEAVSTNVPYTWRCDIDTHSCYKSLRMGGGFVDIALCKLECVGSDTPSLWPRPTGKIRIDNRVQAINIKELQLLGDPDTDLKIIFNLFLAKYKDIPDEDIKSSAKACDLTFKVWSPKRTDLLLESSESYALSVDGNSGDPIHIVITATSYFGARHALETLYQLILYGTVDKTPYVNTLVEIEDKPVFRWRGISVDTSRNFLSLYTLRTIIDGLAGAKLNTFHWHITDSQSFPFESRRQPNMSLYGAYEPDKVYTKTDIQGIVEYAKVRGIRVVPELDAPAHSGYGYEWGAGKPDIGELVVCLNEKPWEKYCYEPPCGQMNVANPNLYIVLKDIITDMVEAFGGEWFHLGGDEVKWECWDTHPDIQQYMLDHEWSRDKAGYMNLWTEYHNKSLQIYRDAASANIVASRKAQVLLWSSGLTTGEDLARLDKDSYVIQYWGSTEDKDHQQQLYDLITKGYRVIMSNYNNVYLDCGFGGWVNAGNNWCSPYKSWQQIYLNDVVDFLKTKFDVEEHETLNLVLGGETAIWTEQAGDENILPKVFPRTWAYAERLWTNPPKGAAAGDLGTWQEAEDRLMYFSELMRRVGVPSNTMKPEWCAQMEGMCLAENSAVGTTTTTNTTTLLALSLLLLAFLTT